MTQMREELFFRGTITFVFDVASKLAVIIQALLLQALTFGKIFCYSQSSIQAFCELCTALVLLIAFKVIYCTVFALLADVKGFPSSPLKGYSPVASNYNLHKRLADVIIVFTH